MLNQSTPLTPKKPGPLRVLTVGRVSTEHQNIENIEASFDGVKRYLTGVYDGLTDIVCLGEQGSGMLHDRASIREAEDRIENGEFDLVMLEDLSRAYRLHFPTKRVG